MLGSIRSVRVTLTSVAIGAGLIVISQPLAGAAALPAEPALAQDDPGKNAVPGKAGRGRRKALRIPRASWHNPATTHRVRLFRSVLRPWTIAGGPRPCGFTPRPEPWKISAPGLTRWFCSRRRRNSIPTRSPSPAGCAGFTSGPWGVPSWRLQYGKRVLSIDPGDTNTLTRLVDYYKKNDPASAEGLLNEVLANPKLDAHAPGRLLAEFELGKLYSGRLRQIDKAADAYAKVLAALDDKSANRLSPVDQARILGDEPSTAYQEFGVVFIAATSVRSGGQGTRTRPGIR